jgi:hypothetical protein
VLGAVGMFGFNVCKKLEAAVVDEPAGKYDTVTIEDGRRRIVQSSEDKNQVELGDSACTNEARISYMLNGSPVK